MVISKKIKILFFAKYGTKGASSRYRIFQYIPYIVNSGFHVDINILFTNADLNRLYKKGSYGLLTLVKAFIRRFTKLLFIFRYDLIIIEYELFPYFPPIFEFMFKISGKKYIVDYDDAIFHNYDLNRKYFIRLLLKNKISRVIKNASAVIAGNPYLFAYASERNDNVRIIPTVVDYSKYISIRPDKKQDKFIIGWIGSPTSGEYLLTLRGVFRKLDKEIFSFKLIGFDENLKRYFKDISPELVVWNEETEIKEIKSFNVGIMPLQNNPWSLGKCGLKLIQYMACGIPVIASPVGINNDIVIHGKNGFLAATENDWYNCILKLYNDRELCEQMGKEGIKIVKEKYSLEKTYPKYIDIITSITK